MRWYIYVICFIAVLLGVFFSFKYYQEFNKASYENGSIDITNQFESEYFNFSTDSIVFYPPDIYDDSNVYTYSNNLVKCPTFDGVNKTYKVVLNGLELNNCDFALGSVSTILHYEFYDVDGSTLSNIDLHLNVNFYSDRTNLVMTVDGSDKAQYIEQYFKDNRFSLKIIEMI